MYPEGKLTFSNFTKESRFADLCKSAQSCTLCERLCSRYKVLSSANGNINSKVLFIAEAPGRLGADKTGVPLYGDRTGDNFSALLDNISWKRKDIFITNAVLCNPRNDSGNNATPTKKEILNCSDFLRMTIELVSPDTIVTLGAAALEALRFIKKHELVLKNCVAMPYTWNGIRLFPLYHPGPRALIHRSIIKQRSDYIKLAKMVDPINGMRPAAKNKTVDNYEWSEFSKLICYVLKKIAKANYFKLTKLLYLVDYYAIKKLRESISGEIYIRQEQGPWPPNLKRAMKFLIDGGFVKNNGDDLSCGTTIPSNLSYDDTKRVLIDDILGKYSLMSNSDIKQIVYLTNPMRFILKEEKKGGDMRNKAVIYKNKFISKVELELSAKD